MNPPTINSTTYKVYRYPGLDNSTAASTTISLSSTSKNSSVTSITVNGQELLITSPVTPGNCNTNSTCATQLAAAIAGAITGADFSATSSGSTVTITAAKWLGNITTTPSTTQSSATLSTSKFSGYKSGSIQVPGKNVRTTLVSALNAYPYPGTNTKAGTRSDCTGTTCTYAEEMTNYSNWWAYYRTRMQMTKAAGTQAFTVLDTKFRLGYMSLNNNTG